MEMLAAPVAAKSSKNPKYLIQVLLDFVACRHCARIWAEERFLIFDLGCFFSATMG
jgi:hypothetical protein